MRFLTIQCFISVCKYHIKLLGQCQNYKQVNKLFIPTFAVCLEWELVLHLVGGWSSFSISWFYVLVFSVFNVLMCFKIVFGLNTYSVTIDLDQTEHYLSAGGYEFIISLTKERYCRHSICIDPRPSNASSGLSKRFCVAAVNSVSIPRFIRSDQLRSARCSNTILYDKSFQTS